MVVRDDNVWSGKKRTRLFVADGSDFEAERLVRRPVVGREEVDDRKLVQLLGRQVEDGLLLRLPVLQKRSTDDVTRMHR